MQHSFSWQCVFLQNWSKLNKSGGGPWPEERESHAACCLNYGQQFPQLLVTGGWDRQGRSLADVWILDMHRGKWRKVKLKPTKLLLLGTSTYPMGSISQKYELVTSCLLVGNWVQWFTACVYILIQWLPYIVWLVLYKSSRTCRPAGSDSEQLLQSITLQP